MEPSRRPALGLEDALRAAVKGFTPGKGLGTEAYRSFSGARLLHGSPSGTLLQEIEREREVVTAKSLGDVRWIGV